MPKPEDSTAIYDDAPFSPIVHAINPILNYAGQYACSYNDWQSARRLLRTAEFMIETAELLLPTQFTSEQEEYKRSSQQLSDLRDWARRISNEITSLQKLNGHDRYNL